SSPSLADLQISREKKPKIDDDDRHHRQQLNQLGCSELVWCGRRWEVWQLPRWSRHRRMGVKKRVHSRGSGCNRNHRSAGTWRLGAVPAANTPGTNKSGREAPPHARGLRSLLAELVVDLIGQLQVLLDGRQGLLGEPLEPGVLQLLGRLAKEGLGPLVVLH